MRKSDGGLRYRKISTAFWNDAKVRTLTDDAKFELLFLLTHPQLLSLGAMRATPAGLAAELQWLPERFREGFRELLQVGIVQADETAGLIVLPNFLKHNKPNPNTVASWENFVYELPECELLAEYFQHVKRFTERLGKPFAERLPERLRVPLPEPIANGTGIHDLDLEHQHQPEPQPTSGSRARDPHAPEPIGAITERMLRRAAL